MNKILALFRALLAVSSPVRKAIGSVLGGATGVGVAEVLNAVGWHLPATVDAALAVVLAAAGTWLAPANKPKPVAPTTMPAPIAAAPTAAPPPAA